MRVASLVPAATEILGFLGVEPVGVSHCCAWPAPLPEEAARV